MKVICILCDQPFYPDKLTEKKIKNHPHLIQICPDCHQRITEQLKRRTNGCPSSTPICKGDQSSND